jgi:hypothetical protein
VTVKVAYTRTEAGGTWRRRGRVPILVAGAGSVVRHQLPTGAAVSSRFQVRVAGVDTGVYPTPYGHIVRFDSDFLSPVQVVAQASTDVSTVTVRPTPLAVTPSKSPHEFGVTVTAPGNYVVLVDGYEDPLLIFASPLEVNPPTAATTGLTYIGPGLYSADEVVVPSGGSLYCHGGAVLASGIRRGAADPAGARVTGGKTFGRAIVDSTLRTGTDGPGRAMRHYNVDGDAVEGLTLLSHTHYAGAVYQSTNVTASRVKVLSWRVGTTGTPDGWDFIASSDCTFDDGFIRSYDDGSSIKAGPRNGYVGPALRNQVKRTVIWQGDAGNGVTVGWEVDVAGTAVADTLWEDLDIVRKTTRADVNRRAAVGIHATGRGSVLRTTARRVRVEEVTGEHLFRIESFYSSDFPAASRSLIDGVTIEDCYGPAGVPSIFAATGAAGGAADADVVPIVNVAVNRLKLGGSYSGPTLTGAVPVASSAQMNATLTNATVTFGA